MIDFLKGYLSVIILSLEHLTEVTSAPIVEEPTSGKIIMERVENEKAEYFYDLDLNTNEAVENKLKPRNWKVETMNANYPMLEVVDENTVKIEGVEYKKVEKPKPITLQRIIEECMLGLNREIQLTLVEHILDRVEVEFFSKLQQEAGYTEVYYKNKGWNNCLKELKGRLRE